MTRKVTGPTRTNTTRPEPLAPISRRDISRYAGRWVAVKGRKVVFAADGQAELVRRAFASKIDELLLIRIPAKGESDIIVY